jgi:hypothetical protein
MKRALPIGKAILRRNRHLKGSAKVAFASAILASAAAASATTILSLDFANPTIGTYGGNPEASQQFSSATSSATYTETDAVYGTGTGATGNYAYGGGGVVPTFANNMMTNASVTSGTPGPGLSVTPAAGTYTFSNSIVMEAEITSAGAQAAGNVSLIQWETDGGVNTTFPRLDLYLTSTGDLEALAFDDNGINLTALSTTTLTPGVQTHVALVYSYSGGHETLTAYTVNDATGQGTALASGTGTVTPNGDTLPNEIGILNTPADAGNDQSGATNYAGRQAFNGSASGINISTFTGTFDPIDGPGVTGEFQLVPEPATLGLLGAVGSMALLRRRRADRPRALTV